MGNKKTSTIKQYQKPQKILAQLKPKKTVEEEHQEQPYEEKEADPSDPIRFASAIDPSLVSSKDDLGQEKVHGPQDQKGPEQPESSGSASNSNEVKAAARGQDHASALEEGKVPAPVPSPTSPVPTDPMDNQR